MIALILGQMYDFLGIATNKKAVIAKATYKTRVFCMFRLRKIAANLACIVVTQLLVSSLLQA